MMERMLIMTRLCFARCAEFLFIKDAILFSLFQKETGFAIIARILVCLENIFDVLCARKEEEL